MHSTKSGCDAEKLVTMIDFFQLKPEASPKRMPYNHMGATLTDTVLQAGLKYATVVKPRVRRVMDCFPGASTTSAIAQLLLDMPARDFLHWQGKDKIERFCSLITMLLDEKVETEADLNLWLRLESNRSELRSIKGIGPKTIDYLSLLVGHEAIPIDRHLTRFAEVCGLEHKDYQELSEVYHAASKTLDVHPRSLDQAIWSFMAWLT